MTKVACEWDDTNKVCKTVKTEDLSSYETCSPTINKKGCLSLTHTSCKWEKGDPFIPPPDPVVEEETSAERLLRLL